MKKNLLFFSAIILCFDAFSQVNLVPNPGFEDYNTCPVCCYGVGSEGSDVYLTDWFNPNGATADYFNTCGEEATSGGVPYTLWWGYNTSHRCDGMAGFFTYLSGWREYVEIKLTEPLVAGTVYYVEFYATTAFLPIEESFYGSYDFVIATDEMGLCFTEEKIEDFGYDALTAYTPQIENEEGNYLSDSSKWYRISGVYTALGGEEYITIGNFKSFAETDYELMYGEEEIGTSNGYAFVDDVLVTEFTGVLPDESGDVILCEGQDVDLTAPFLAVSYLWSTGATSQTINVDEEGEYWVDAYFECDTEHYAYNVIVFPSELETSLEEIKICANDLPITLYGEPGNDTYEWNTGGFADSLVITEGGLYYVEASNICNIIIDSFLVDALDPEGISIFLGMDTLICTYDAWEMRLDATGEFDTYEWNTGSTSPTISVNEQGTYSVTAENICGTWFDEINITTGTPLVKPELGDKVVLCEADGLTEVIFTAEEQECYYLWSTGETTNSIIVHEPGFFWVECTNNCGKVRDSVVVQLCTYIYMPNAFSPNGDGINDELLPVYYPGVELISFNIYNRWGELVFQTNDITKGWDGSIVKEDLTTKEQPIETYVYVIEFAELGYAAQRKGSITLVR